MNIVKGVADLIRRSSSGHTGESPGSQGERLSPPTPRIRFSVVCKRIRTSHKGGEPKNSPKSMDLPLLDRVLSWMNLGKKDNEGSLEGTFKP
ncbi:hypothetical protein Godav_003517 [Gossypium davidsonii]|uniref:Uncharacterized protein n=2 Tax=Gossypium TaxID=3633 RepID=A0A7J8SJG2_GOSDV|nr:hypothetical protein [Gossypium davidsonii]MBA0661334.1 hypothetical protein [Gossypium klotzschianum]